MTHLEPSFSVNVDVTNPGQFFACCGLLELSHRAWPSDQVEGWFGNSTFYLSARGDQERGPKALFDLLCGSDIEIDDARGERAVHPVCMKALGMTLDWWIDERGEKTPLKLWAGQQSSIRIATDLQDALARLGEVKGKDLFDAGMPLTGRYGVDPRTAWNALDVGFSPNEQGMEVVTFPAVELLAAVGLQGFRPTQNEIRSFRYSIWTVPLPVIVARAVSMGLIPGAAAGTYRFQIATRGSYKGFDFARGDET